jgi:ketosteroid isomerase-like protein
MATEDTRAAVMDFYGAYVQGDMDRVASYIDHDIKWVIYAPSALFHFAGPRQGKGAVLETLAAIANDYALESYEPKIVMADGDRAAVISDVRFSQRKSQRILNFRIADVMRLEGGRIVEFEEFVDSVDVVEQATGQLFNFR